MFSRRWPWDGPPNRLAGARRAREQRGLPLLDLTVSNPTAVGLDYPLAALGEAMSRAAAVPYEPDARGLLPAREALSAALGCSADDLLLTASTSEAYSYLFKLLADPGDEILTATPAYPLLEHLTALDGVALRHFALEYHGARWHLHAERAREKITSRTRAMVIVHPNNPTGSYVREAELAALAALDVPLIADEVFFDYPLGERPASAAERSDTLTFALGGLSKQAGLPHYKLGWIRAAGPPEARRAALRALELIADSYLSVSTPVQAALPDLLEIAPTIREAIRRRCRESLAALDAALQGDVSLVRLPVEGGWSAVLRVRTREPEEDLALRLLEEQGVVIHPGYFFDFEDDGFLVISLLTRPEVLREGLRRVIETCRG